MDNEESKVKVQLSSLQPLYSLLIFQNSAGAIFMAIGQFGQVLTEFTLAGFTVCKVPMYVVYNNRGLTANRIMFFQNQVDVCLLFYRGKVNKDHLVNFNATLRDEQNGYQKNVKYYEATAKREVCFYS
jgi:hypothetical protein